MEVTRPMFEIHDTQPFILKTKRMDEREEKQRKQKPAAEYGTERDGRW